ncbi:hypothetical protein A3C28_04855 [Candidatus Roizmanbacteria bacterium RIFCSPHIGHO2_02_FULL_39_9]|uniref:Glycosyltransferase 2-like domain-containing protein n=2 Tax=Candidatus Roizmaniibacteriota TaxID=1752723 RepID=A0A1F7I3Z2_9BACT|nr:MAG: hypothetical protein A3C28_04855 [Candidatus Roizmanbacteria bacterium RIFCSPHIGHO2_02_FULL_39_9]OGK38105.1 MAG: hypothetical protein A3F60_00485 [Candidatus Roizmanbacteria bacterium RIFCSPHIGHO2_12_FULL_39_8]
MTKPDLSIVLVSYNTKNITRHCLESISTSLKNSKLTVEVIVIDNGSKDGSIEMLKKVQSSEFIVHSENIKLKIISSNKNLGFGKANNQGVKEALSDYILLLNSDTVVLDDAIEKLYDFFKKNEKKVNFVGGKLLNKDLSPQPSCGPSYSLKMVFAHLFLRGDYWGLTRYSPDVEKEVDWISGACILTKKQYFESLEGFDDKIFMYMEEIDLFYRAKKRGLTVFFYPEARFIHLGSASSGARIYPILQVFRGLLFFYQKHRSRQALLLLRIMLQLKALVGLILGYVSGNTYLKETYAKALEISRLD